MTERSTVRLPPVEQQPAPLYYAGRMLLAFTAIGIRPLRLPADDSIVELVMHVDPARRIEVQHGVKVEKGRCNWHADTTHGARSRSRRLAGTVVADVFGISAATAIPDVRMRLVPPRDDRSAVRSFQNV